MVTIIEIDNRLKLYNSKIDGETKEYYASSEKLTIICYCGNKVIKSIGKIMDTGRYICCKSCSNIKRAETNIKKYGVPNAMQSSAIKDKAKHTNLLKYGTDCPLQSSMIKEKIINTNRERYGTDYGVQSNIVKQKIKKSFIDRFGVDNPNKNKDIVNKTKVTNLNKYGTECVLKSDIIKEKIINTNIEKYGTKYGVQSDIVKEKIKETLIDRYGVDHNLKIQSVKDRIKETNIKLYGSEFPMQNIDVMEKSIKKSYYNKKYIYPSGNQIMIQGYENFALDDLLKNNISENEIVTDKKLVPTIWYNDKNSNKRRHYVDIFIPTLNKCIEVKSSWTYKINKETVIAKKNSALNMGFLYEIWVYDSKGIREIII